jgi:tRNA A37 threonylcarbamoyladenosine synthetase subunit TsaC/SUA5/YrdC
VGIRVPDHPVILELARALGRPVISTTAGPHGGDPYVDPAEIADAWPQLAMVLDAGAGGDVPTTVVDITDGRVEVVREGAGDPDLFRGSLSP